MRHVLGLDLGQASEPTAVVVVEGIVSPEVEARRFWGRQWEVYKTIYGLPKQDVVEPPFLSFAVRHAERIGPGVPYPEIVGLVKGLLGDLNEPILAIDATGVGRPTVELFEKAGMRPVVITISGGETVSYEGGYAHVPKKDLISAAQVFLQTGKLKIAKALPLAETMLRELQLFRMKVALASGPEAAMLWREGPQDDLVLALAVSIYAGIEGIRVPPPVPTTAPRGSYSSLYWAARRRH
jgi:hypothetical protein